MTSNPTIFQAAIAEGDAYDEQLREVLKTETEPKEVFLALAVEDIRGACDILRPVWDEVGENARDGWVSLEVDPNLAHDTQGTIDEAKRLHALVDRPNLFVKIPATKEGLPAIEESIAAGIPINVTLIFSLERHREVAEAYVRGVQRLADAGGDLARMASVASFFVSRVDTEADKRLDEIGGHDELKGTLAIANAKLAYETYKQVFAGEQWEALRAKGASAQRCLWASTSTKNPEYRDVIYVEELIGRDTVNTMPRETVEAFQDHGKVRDSLEEDVDGARRTLEAFAAAGIDYDDVVETLEREGVEKFAKSFQQLFADVEAKRDAMVRGMSERFDELGQQLRVDSVRSSAAAGSGHPTSSMSAADLMAVLLDGGYLRMDTKDLSNPANDHLIFSKGHASPLYYAVLKAAGIIDDAELLTFRKLDSRLEGHPTPRIPPTDVATGSLGQGLPIAVGVALAGRRLDRLPYRVWCLCGDSEMAEGSIWEAFEHAAFNGLDNLTAIIDVNRLGQTRETMVGWDLDRYVRRAEAFGWNAIAIDGHDVDAIAAAYDQAVATDSGPTVIVAQTKKGKGVKAVEDQPGKHGKPLDDPEAAIEELGGERDLTVEIAAPEAGSPHEFSVPGGELPTLGARRGGGHAQGLRRGAHRARRDARRRRRARRRGLELDALGDVPRGARGALLRDVHRRAAAGRRGGRHAGARLGAVRLDVRGLPLARVRLHPHGGDLARRHPPLRLARRRLDRRGRPVADGARGHRGVPRDPRLDGAAPLRRQPDGEARRRDGRPRGHLVHPHPARQDRGAHAARTRTSRSAARGSCATATTSRSWPAGSPSTRRSRRRSSWPATASRRA